MMATTVIIFGAHALDRAEHDRLHADRLRVNGAQSARRTGTQLLQGLVEIDQHDDAGFGRDTGKGDKTDSDSDAKS